MSKYLFIFISLYLLSFSYQGTSEPVDQLFGDLYNGTIYSGYLKTTIPGNELFYVYMPCQNPTETTPLMLWLNGGPGCSSLFGMLAEVGPVISKNFADEFKINEYSWNLNSNLLFIEQPAGVGFSKTSDPSFNWTDDVTAESLLCGIKDFLESFPELKQSDFYVSGESYAGVYIPFLVKKIYEDTSTEKVNLKGVLIGNPLTYFDTDSERSLVEFSLSHGIISLETFNSFERHCPHKKDELHPEEDDYDDIYDNENEQLGDILTPRNVTHRCNEIRSVIRDNLQGNDIYGIYRLCPNQSRIDINDPLYYNQKYGMKNFILDKLNPNKNKIFEKNNFGEDLEPELIIWPDSCGDDLTFDRFLNNETIKEKLNVYDTSVTWSQCSDINYEMSESINFYLDIESKYSDLRVWVFSGTEDGVLPTLGTMRWVNYLNFTVEEKWRQWKVDDQVGGFVQKYKEGLTIVTVKGSGHMVPQDQSSSAYTLFNAFLNGGFPE